MNDWARSQLMAPVYALVVSFAVSLLIGAALAPDQVKPPVAQVTETVVPDPEKWDAEFAVQEGDGSLKPTAELRDVAVQFGWSAGKDLKPDTNGTFSLPMVARWPMTICAALPEQWRPRDPKFAGPNGLTCWNVAKPPDGERIRLVVIRNEG